LVARVRCPDEVSDTAVPHSCGAVDEDGNLMGVGLSRKR
jgi:hypothetical protein